MAKDNRIEPVVDENNVSIEDKDAAITEVKSVLEVVEKSVQLDASGVKAVQLDESDADKSYRESIEALVENGHARINQIEAEAQDHLSIANAFINPGDSTPFDSFGDPGDLEQASNMLIAHITWQKVIDRGLEQEAFRVFSDKFGKAAKDVLPLVMGNPSLGAEAVEEVRRIYPDIWDESFNLAKHGDGKSIFQAAGYTDAIIERIDPSVLQHVAVVAQHEKAFPVEGLSVEQRLKDPSAKKLILDALGNKNVQRSMKWAGLAIGCVTGGIVIKAGMTGASFLAGKLAENKAVVSLCSRLEGSAIKFVSKTFNIDEKKVRDNVDYCKGVAERVSNNKWVALGSAAAMVGVAVALGQLDLVSDAVDSVASTAADVKTYVYGEVAEMVNPVEFGDSLSDRALIGLGAVGENIIDPVKEKLGFDTGVSKEALVVDAPQAADPAKASEDLSDARPLLADRSENLSVEAPEHAEVPFDPAGDDHKKASLPEVKSVSAEASQPSSSEPSSKNSPLVAESVSQPGVVAVTTSYEVKSGDSLWKIAERHLESSGSQASNADIQKMVDQLYEANKDVIGSDKDLIFPGQELNMNVAELGSDLSANHAGNADRVAIHQGVKGLDSGDELTKINLMNEETSRLLGAAIDRHPNIGMIGTDSLSSQSEMSRMAKEVFSEPIKVSKFDGLDSPGKG